MTIDHVGILVPKDRYKELLDFYVAALGPLGYKLHMEPVPGVAGIGKEHPDWWITAVESSTVGNIHVAFGTTGKSRGAAVDGWMLTIALQNARKFASSTRLLSPLGPRTTAPRA
jgi:catechol 2,3-dioxygenase-like lactoylglutathione lyase family enzyme